MHAIWLDSDRAHCTCISADLCESKRLTRILALSLVLTVGPTEVRWQYGRLDNESTTNTLVTNLTIPVGSTAQVMHDTQLDRGACSLRVVSESGVELWSAQEQHRLGRDHAVQLPKGVFEAPVVLEGQSGSRQQTKTMVGSGQFLFEAQYVC